jgi:hypothetical protein
MQHSCGLVDLMPALPATTPGLSGKSHGIDLRAWADGLKPDSRAEARKWHWVKISLPDWPHTRALPAVMPGRIHPFSALPSKTFRTPPGPSISDVTDNIRT